MKKFLAMLLTLCLTCSVALAEETPPNPEEPSAGELPTEQQPAPWAAPYVADAYSLKLVDDNYQWYIEGPISQEDLAAMVGQVHQKLSLLTGAENAAPTPEEGTTRGDVVKALGQAMAATVFEEGDPVEMLQQLGVLQGDGNSLALERTCSYQEAMVMATRLILAVYDQADAGSKGLLWKVENKGNTLYLLGTYHVDRGNLYPFHKTLRQAIQSADQVTLELDFNDQAGLQEFAAMQVYGEGDSLKDHIPEELYTRTVAAFETVGLSEEQIAMYKPWALAATITSLMTADETAGDTPMAVDLYVNALAVNGGIPVVGAETYAFQGGIFDSLSPEYQEAYLEGSVALYEASLAGEEAEVDAEAAAALEEQDKQLTAMMNSWKSGDLEGFNSCYDKAAILNSDDELNARLFTDRDPNMVKVAQSYLELEGENVNFVAFGAGHMVAPGGIVPELEKLGYTVTQIK